MCIPHILALPLPGMCSKKTSHKETEIRMFTEALFVTVENWQHRKCLSALEEINAGITHNGIQVHTYVVIVENMMGIIKTIQDSYYLWEGMKIRNGERYSKTTTEFVMFYTFLKGENLRIRVVSSSGHIAHAFVI